MNARLVQLVLTLSTALAADPGLASFKPQVLAIPAEPGVWVWPLFQDADGDGRMDLLALVPAEQTLWFCRQEASGFGSGPDQKIELPAHTGWIILRDVDPQPGLELLCSTASGLVYLRQNQGRFDPTFHSLIRASQWFSSNDLPRLNSPAQPNKVGDAIPVIERGQAVLYEKDEGPGWSPARRLDLELLRTTWNVGDPDWSAGTRPARSLNIRSSFFAREFEPPPVKPRDPDPVVQEFIGRIRNENKGPVPESQTIDLNGDGKEDAALWLSRGDLQPRTDVFLFWRGADGRLPQKPTRVLRHPGLPVRSGPARQVSPVWDLDGDGVCELVLLALRTKVTSWSSLLDMALSHGVDWALTVRPIQNPTRSERAETAVPLTTMLPFDHDFWELVRIEGDFNGDRRPDVIAQRSLDRYEVHFSRAAPAWFESKPGLVFQTPVEGVLRVEDLNADGLSDLWMQSQTEPRLAFFLSQPDPPKGSPP